MSIKDFFNIQLILFLAICFAYIGAGAAFSKDFRTWVDSSGNHQIEAIYIRSDGERVLLKKPNGKQVWVPLLRLSSHDRNYAISLGKQVADAAVPSSIEPLENQQAELRFANYKELTKYVGREVRESLQALELFRKFAQHDHVDKQQSKKAIDALPIWEKRSKEGLIRHGRDWLSPEEIDRFKEKEIQALREAHRLIDVKNDRLALDRFKDASKLNKEGIRSDFYLGLLNVLVSKHPLTSVQHFDECVDRLEASPDRLVGTRRANHVAALNNLAVAQVRTKKYDRAIRNWEKAIEISPQTPELVQNLGLLTRLGGTGSGSRLSNRIGDKAGELYAKVTVANSSSEFDDSVGWLYLPLIDSLDGTMGEGGDSELRSVAWATGVAVAPNLILTTTHVTADAQRYRITGGPSGFGKVVAIDPCTNLALIRFEDLNAKPISWSMRVPSRASTLNLVGHAQPGFGAVGVRSIESTILNVKEYKAYDIKYAVSSISITPQGGLQHTQVSTTRRVGSNRVLLNHDVVADSGFIGSPLCDSRGKAFAIHLGSKANQARAGVGHSLAETSSSVLDFVSSAVGDFDVDSSVVANGEIADPLGGIQLDLNKTIFQIVGLQFAPRLQWSHRIANLHSSGNEGGWTSYEDRACFSCNGNGTRECTNRKCKRGRVKKYTTSSYQTSDGSTVTKRVPTYEACPTCRGSGKLKCGICAGGGTI